MIRKNHRGFFDLLHFSSQETFLATGQPRGKSARQNFVWGPWVVPVAADICSCSIYHSSTRPKRKAKSSLISFVSAKKSLCKQFCVENSSIKNSRCVQGRFGSSAGICHKSLCAQFFPKKYQLYLSISCKRALEVLLCQQFFVKKKSVS